MTNLELFVAVVAAVAAVAVIGLVGLVLAIRDRPDVKDFRVDPDDRPRFFDGVRGVIDRSIGIYLLRLMTRRPTPPPVEPPARPTALTADEVAYRIGLAGAPAPPPSDESVPPAPAGAAAMAAAARAAAARQASAVGGGTTGPVSGVEHGTRDPGPLIGATETTALASHSRSPARRTDRRAWSP